MINDNSRWCQRAERKKIGLNQLLLYFREYTFRNLQEQPMAFYKWLGLITLVILVSGCSRSTWLVVPYEYQEQVKRLPSLLEKRELLYNVPYSAKVIHSSPTNAVTHYRPEHTYTFIWHEIETDQDGFNLGDLLRVKQTGRIGFAIRRHGEKAHWGTYYLNEVNLEEQDGVNIVYLPN